MKNNFEKSYLCVMVTKINIKNFKSIVELELPLGRFNVLIGANGSGKTNILEAVSFGISSVWDKLDNEFLGLRGIRITEPKFMISGFDNSTDTIINGLQTKERKYDNSISYYEDRKRWGANRVGVITHSVPDECIKSFLSYCPEESALRTFREEIQTLPLGRKGEGLFRYLKELGQTEKGISILHEIKENLSLLDWYDDLKIPESSFSNDSTVMLRDRYLNETLQYFDQRSANEGFLYLLFYLTLFISDETPDFFAIDNIESAFNPKMCTEVIRTLTALSRKHGKQVIVTTHNSAVLDGLNLASDDERLFVVCRNIDGHTQINRIGYKPERTMKLSEIWLNGFIGGLPDNF
jgi:predicted ATPase